MYSLYFRPHEFWDFLITFQVCLCSLPSHSPEAGLSPWSRLVSSWLPSPEEHGPGYSHCPSKGHFFPTQDSPGAQMLSGLILPLSLHTRFLFLPNTSFNFFLLRLSVALPSHWRLSEWHSLTNRKSVCGQDSSVQVLLEDVKVWRRVTKPTNGISPPATQLAFSHPLKGNVY